MPTRAVPAVAAPLVQRVLAGVTDSTWSNWNGGAVAASAARPPVEVPE